MDQITHLLKAEDFRRLELSGVTEVTGFDTTLIELSLESFTLFIGGQELKIEAFSRESKQIAITGNIDSILRENTPAKKARSFFSRLFS